MNRFVRYAFASVLYLSTAITVAHAQAGIFNPNDPVVNYNPSSPPAKPATGLVGKWVRTPRVSWNSSSFKCYIYNNMAFRLKYPKNYDSNKVYPVMIFLHGKGEYGTIYDNEYQLHLGGNAHSLAVDQGKFEGFLLYPQNDNASSDGFWSTGDLSNINNLLEKVMIPQKKVDPFRVYVNGLSAGGNSTWDFLRRYSKLVTAITPISSASTSYSDSVQKYKFTPIYHFQGALDDNPQPSTSRALGSRILTVGGNYQYLEFPNYGHACWNHAWADPDYFPFYSRAHKANPWPLYGRTEFCEGEAFSVTIGVTPGFEEYQWRKNGALISDATANTLVVTEYGTYDCRIRKGTTWSVWSPRPVVIKPKAPTVQPTITVTGGGTNVIPAPDGSTSVPLEVPTGYATYNWIKEGSATTLSTTRALSAASAGNYKVKVTEQNGCPTPTTSTPSTTARIQAEKYKAMSGVQLQTTTDAGGGQNVAYIDRGDWMDYTINAPVSGLYRFTLRLASPNNGGELQLKNAAGLVLAFVSVPYTGGWQTYQNVVATASLNAGTQTLRIQSTAITGWNFNWFDVTSPGANGNPDGFSNPFPVVDANGSNAPDAPTDLTATALSKTSIQLAWNQTATPAYNETGFEVYEATAEDGPYKFKSKTAANATGITYSGLTSGTTYFYKVRAVNTTAASAAAGPATATTQADVTAPTTPANLRLSTITKTTIDLLWSAATDDMGVAYYDVYINNVKTRVVSGKSTGVRIFNLVPNTSYTFVLRARDAAGNVSANSNQVTGKTLSGTVTQDPSMTPADPANFSVYINLNVDNPAGTPWNNTNKLPEDGLAFNDFKNYSGNVSGVDLTLQQNFTGYNPGGMNTGNNSGVYPDNVMRSSYYCDKGQVAILKVSDLSLNHKYSFVFFGSRNGTGDRTSVYKIGSQQVSLNASMNTTNTVQIDNVVPDQNGNVYIEVSLGATAMYAYLNSLVIKAYSKNTTVLTQTSTTSTTLAATTTPLVQAYPNPVQTDVLLTTSLNRSVPELYVKITDASGSVLSTQRFTNVPQGTWQQRLPLLGRAAQPGVYFIYITGLPDGKSQVLKVMKVR